MTNREFSIIEMAKMFDLNRDTVRKRLAAHKIKPLRKHGNKKLFDLALAGPALFKDSALTYDQ